MFEKLAAVTSRSGTLDLSVPYFTPRHVCPSFPRFCTNPDATKTAVLLGMVVDQEGQKGERMLQSRQ